MDDHDVMTGHHVDTSRPALGFPLGTALLLIVIFCISGFFSCCYHWDKLRSLRRSFSSDMEADTDTVTIQSPSKSTPLHLDAKLKRSQSLPVLMPGDQIPKYIAKPCPCEHLPPPPERIIVEVQSPPPPPPL
ncbi:uncharacterized protein At5g65660-like [Tasmannia lanceolata]|uniref:uncharacterized protein At5g65660-like n=1 Tax=Tasmannia lanceolata TaxID=3420 RepID=UPI004063ABB7